MVDGEWWSVKQDMGELGDIYLGENGAEVDWTLPLPGELSTNIASTRLHDGFLTLAAGKDNNVLRVWTK